MANPLVKAVCRAMERIAPLQLAGTWDNVGLLLESPTFNPSRKDVMLTIDLTPDVMEETLLSSNAGIVLAYHPPIFGGLKSLTLGNPLQKSILTCAAQGISIYSPHSALDNVYGGINDWIAQGVLENPKNGSVKPLLETDIGPNGAEGRLVELLNTITVDALVKRMKAHLGVDHIQLGCPMASSGLSTPVQTVAICAGSGASMLQGKTADVYLTGEMSHHEVLAAIAAGVHVMICGHTNTERGFLPILAKKLRNELDQELRETGTGLAVGEVIVSTRDAHPLKVL